MLAMLRSTSEVEPVLATQSGTAAAKHAAGALRGRSESKLVVVPRSTGHAAGKVADEGAAQKKLAKEVQYRMAADLRLNLRTAEVEHRYEAAGRIQRDLAYWEAKDTHADPAAVQELLAEDARTTALNEAEFQNRKAKRESLARRRQHSEEVAAEHRQVLTGLEALLNNALAGHDYKAAKHLHDQILRKEELFKDTDELASCFALCCCRGRRAAADDEMDEHVEAFEDEKDSNRDFSIDDVYAELSSAEIAEYQTGFTKFARLGDWIDLEEYSRLMNYLNERAGASVPIEQHELEQLFSQIAKQNVIKQDDFLIQMYDVRANVSMQEVHRIGFEIIDRHSDKYIGPDDLVAFVQKSSPQVENGKEDKHDPLTSFTQEIAVLMIQESEAHTDDGGLDLFDHQLNFDEYCTTVTEVARNEAAFPATRKFWLAMESRLQLAQAIGLLRQD